MASVIFLQVVPLLVCFSLVSEVIDFVEGLPLQGQNVFYTRYVRRRPIPYSNKYVKEVVEVFKTKRRPPPYAFLHDEDLTRFVRCDFDPSMPDCDGVYNGDGDDYASPIKSTSTTPAPGTSTERVIHSYGSIQPSESTTSKASFSFWKSLTTKMPITTATSLTEVVSTLSPSTTSTERSSFWWSPTTKMQSTTTTTEQNIYLTETDDESLPPTPLTLLVTTSTATTPQLSEEYDDDISEAENDNIYEDGTGNDNKSKETGDLNANEYDETDEVQTTENTIKDTDGYTEAQIEDTSVRPTKKSVFNWF